MQQRPMTRRTFMQAGAAAHDTIKCKAMRLDDAAVEFVLPPKRLCVFSLE